MINGRETSLTFILGRGGFFCRGFLKSSPFFPLDFGRLPTALELLDHYFKIEKFWPHLRFRKSYRKESILRESNPLKSLLNLLRVNHR